MRHPLLIYASAMGAGRNRDALKEHGLGMLVSPLDQRGIEGFRHCLDNGAWPAFQAWLKARMAEGVPETVAMAEWIAGRYVEGMLDEALFEQAMERYGPTADFVVLPDIVAGGKNSLDLSIRWINRSRSLCNLVLIAVQDGMTEEDLAPHVGRHVGIFLGGSTEWKLDNMRRWGVFCASVPCEHPTSTREEPVRGCWYHVARVNTQQRIAMAINSGADSVDGSSPSRFSVTTGKLAGAAKNMSLLDPRVLA